MRDTSWSLHHAARQKLITDLSYGTTSAGQCSDHVGVPANHWVSVRHRKRDSRGLHDRQVGHIITHARALGEADAQFPAQLLERAKLVFGALNHVTDPELAASRRHGAGLPTGDDRYLYAG